MASGNSTSPRKRGVILTPVGAQKIRDAITHIETEENLGQRLTITALSVRTCLTSDTVSKVLDREQGVDRRTLESFFRAFNLELNASDYCCTDLKQTQNKKGISSPALPSVTTQIQINWGEIPNISTFYGRIEELETLTQWLQIDRCRLIAVLGIGGIGKTSLVAKLLEYIVRNRDSSAVEFEYVIWQSLRHAPPLEETVTRLIHVFPNQQAINLPDSPNQLISWLMQCLSQARCLVILDNLETILQTGDKVGLFQKGFEGYEELIWRVGELPHKSCLILTSRERPRKMGWLEGKKCPVRSLLLKGLSSADGLRILREEGIDKTEADWQALVHQYAGNPLALKIAANTIRVLFPDNIDRFLTYNINVFGNIFDLLNQQFMRLSETDKTVVYWLAIHQEPVSLAELIDVIIPPITAQKLVGVLESLRWRSWVESNSKGFTMENIIMEYIISHFVEQVRDELQSGKLHLINYHALLQATAKPEIRETQTRLILKPIADGIVINEVHWASLLQICRSQPHLASGYAAGNLLNLLSHCNQDLHHYDFSRLTIRQADLREVNLQQVNFEQATFIRSTLPNPLP